MLVLGQCQIALVEAKQARFDVVFEIVAEETQYNNIGLVADSFILAIP